MFELAQNTRSKRRPMPSDLRTLPRPKPGSWLDVKAKQICQMLADEHGLEGLDPDQMYLLSAELIRQNLADLAVVMGMSAAACQRYITTNSLRAITTWMAESLSAEKPGTDPFGDTQMVTMQVEVWARGILSLQLAALACMGASAAYSRSLVKLCSSMTGTLVPEGAVIGRNFQVPKAGATYAARILHAASEQVAIWDCTTEGITREQLAAGLAYDADRFAKVLAAQ